MNVWILLGTNCGFQQMQHGEVSTREECQISIRNVDTAVSFVQGRIDPQYKVWGDLIEARLSSLPLVPFHFPFRPFSSLKSS